MAKKKNSRKKAVKKKSTKKKVVGGPFLTAAVLCEKIIAEKNNVVSLIRIVDRFTLSQITNLPQGFNPPLGFTVFAYISFKSGDFKGKRTLTLKTILASGEPSEKVEIPLVFQGGTQGPTTHAEIGLPAKEGVHWIEIRLDGKLIAKMPYEVILAKKESTAAR